MPLEIERKFLIEMPDLEWIAKTQDVEIVYIVQTYLGRTKDGYGNRVREMEKKGVKKYYHTAKKSLHGFTRIEIEKEISKKEYENYLNRKDLTTLTKTRYVIKLNQLKYEIDIYPFWTKTAIMEVELKSENQVFEIPDFVKVIGEVTNNLDYSNQSLAKKYLK